MWTERQRAAWLRRTVLDNPYLSQFLVPQPDGTLRPFDPHPRQREFLSDGESLELFYGGAGGGGKSAALLAGALQGCQEPGYAALILRRTYQDLSLPGALMSKAQEWLGQLEHMGVRWDATGHTWHFPTGASITFGYLQNPGDEQRYRSAEFQYIAFDELTEFEELPYLFLFSRLRRRAGLSIPLRMRSASNPGGVGHEWVKARFVSPTSPGFAGQMRPVFIRAYLKDNPSLSESDYRRSLAHLDTITRAQIEAGDWDAYAGGRFKREWFRRFTRRWQNGQLVYELHQPGGGHRDVIGIECPVCMMVDPACTAEQSSDHTAWCVGALTGTNDVLILEADRDRIEIHDIPRRVLAVAQRWDVQFVGVEALAAFRLLAHEMELLPGMPSVRRLSPWGRSPPGMKMKLVRAIPAINRTEAGQVYLLASSSGSLMPWAEGFISECVRFTGDPEKDSADDQVDAFGYLVREMERGYGGSEKTTAELSAVIQGKPRERWPGEMHRELPEGQSYIDLESGDGEMPGHRDGRKFWWDRGRSRFKERYG